MEHQKILNLLNETGDSKFVTRKQNTVIDQSNRKNDSGSEIIYNTEVLNLNIEILKSVKIYDYNDAYILAIGDNTAIAVYATQVSFKYCAHLLKVSQKLMEQQKRLRQRLMPKDYLPKGGIKIITLLPMEKTFMTDLLILI